MFSCVFVYIAHFTGFSRFVLHFQHCFCIIQIRIPDYLIVYWALSSPQRKSKHSTYNNMKEGDFLMKYGHFDDVHQEYVITTPKTPLPWINYLGCNEFSVWYPTPAADIPSIRMPNCCVWPVIVTIMYRQTSTANICILRMEIPYGIPAGSLRRPSWILTSAVTVSVTAVSPLPRTVLRLPCSPSFLWMITVRSLSWLWPTEAPRTRSCPYSLM